MHGEQLAAAEEVGSRPERVSAGEDRRLRPPQRNFLPSSPEPDRQELEGADRLGRDDVVPDSQPFRDARAIAVVPVEQLDDAGRLAERTDSLLHTVGVDRVHEPHARSLHERV